MPWKIVQLQKNCAEQQVLFHCRCSSPTCTCAIFHCFISSNIISCNFPLFPQNSLLRTKKAASMCVLVSKNIADFQFLSWICVESRQLCLLAGTSSGNLNVYMPEIRGFRCWKAETGRKNTKLLWALRLSSSRRSRMSSCDQELRFSDGLWANMLKVLPRINGVMPSFTHNLDVLERGIKGLT